MVLNSAGLVESESKGLGYQEEVEQEDLLPQLYPRDDGACQEGGRALFYASRDQQDLPVISHT